MNENVKLPMYKAIMEEKNLVGIPLKYFLFLVFEALLLFMFVGSFLIIIPVIITAIFIKMATRKDKKNIELYITSQLEQSNKFVF